MMPLSIGSATEVYDNASRCEIVRHWVDHPELAEVSRLLRSLANSLGEEAEDEYWRHTLGPIRKLAYFFCSVPLPFAEAVKAAGIDWAKVQRQVRMCEQIFPDSHESLAAAVHSLERLIAAGDSPLIPPLEALLSSTASLSVMIRNSRANQAAAAYFATNPKLRTAKVVNALQFRGRHVCDVLATIGPCTWFPEYVFTAPRSGTIHVISYRWIRDNWRPGPVFLHDSVAGASENPSHRIGILPKVVRDTPPSTPASSDMQPADLLPPLPAFARNAHRLAASGSLSTEETVPARLCHLSGDRAVFVAADDGATSLIIDTSETGRSSVRRVSTRELDPGFYLLLRTSGGGDFIAPLADRILGDNAAARRSQQAEWKRDLMMKAVEKFGQLRRRELASRVATYLRSQQLSQARPANVHYWMSAKCISPRKAEDFEAILAFAGLAHRLPELSAAMQDIDRAHKRAGFSIRRMLLQKTTETSLEPLERDGEMVFDLGDSDGGTLSAFQITAVQEEDFEIPADRIGVLLETEDETWHV